MRFTFETDDGIVGTLKEHGRVIYRGVSRKSIARIIREHTAGDEWRSSIVNMKRSWELKSRPATTDGWDVWAHTRYASWRNRCRATLNALANGNWTPHPGVYVNGSRQRQGSDWERAFIRMCRAMKTPWSKKSEWDKWSINKATGHRKRMRAKRERNGR